MHVQALHKLWRRRQKYGGLERQEPGVYTKDVAMFSHGELLAVHTREFSALDCGALRASCGVALVGMKCIEATVSSSASTTKVKQFWNKFEREYGRDGGHWICDVGDFDELELGSELWPHRVGYIDPRYM
jgi:hypothetical protein